MRVGRREPRAADCLLSRAASTCHHDWLMTVLDLQAGEGLDALSPLRKNPRAARGSPRPVHVPAHAESLAPTAGRGARCRGRSGGNC